MEIKEQKSVQVYFFFLLDVAITNAYILLNFSGRPCPFKDVKSFRLQLSKELIGDYCSGRCRGRGGSVIHSLPSLPHQVGQQ